MTMTMPDQTNPENIPDFYDVLNAEMLRLLTQIQMIGQYNPVVGNSLMTSATAIMSLFEAYVNWANPLLADIEGADTVVIAQVSPDVADGLSARDN